MSYITIHTPEGAFSKGDQLSNLFKNQMPLPLRLSVTDDGENRSGLLKVNLEEGYGEEDLPIFRKTIEDFHAANPSCGLEVTVKGKDFLQLGSQL